MRHNVSQHCQKYLSYQTRRKDFCEEKKTIYDSPTVEQFENFLPELFNQGESRSVLVSAKRMKYQQIPQNPQVIKYFKGTFNLRPPSPKFCFVCDGCANYV